uniref:Uncharacterized protein n=1 Tax=Klebsiella pneumoniae TaxID=573 RepID=A0A8B0SV26_KLEPN|nr:hypothetical protein [Klebsiella pneumoniae]
MWSSLFRCINENKDYLNSCAEYRYTLTSAAFPGFVHVRLMACARRYVALSRFSRLMNSAELLLLPPT